MSHKKNNWNSLVAFLLIIFGQAQTYADWIQVNTKQVPITRLISNAEKVLKKNPSDVQTLALLARLHSMAYATEEGEATVDSERESLFWGYVFENAVPFKRKAISVSQKARVHLNTAINFYRKAIQKTDPKHEQNINELILGLGWTLKEKGDVAEAKTLFRKIIKTGKSSANRTEYGLEAAWYLKPLLDPKTDADEIKILDKMFVGLGKFDPLKGKPIYTPLAIPLGTETRGKKLLNQNARVEFDLDGSGVKTWNWIQPNAAWLVFDPKNEERIKSGIQLFGNVTFWLFWKNGYEVLQALDNDGNDWLEEDELEGIALWNDKNSNGQSERGEILSLEKVGLVALSCRYRKIDGILTSQAKFSNGTFRPTYDLILKRQR